MRSVNLPVRLDYATQPDYFYRIRKFQRRRKMVISLRIPAPAPVLYTESAPGGEV